MSERQAIVDWASKIPIHDLSDGKGLCRVIFAEDFLRALKDLPSAQPTADVQVDAQVLCKHGKWIHKDGSKFLWVCSECGQVIYSEHDEDREKFHAFCGACGADMRERRSDAEVH